MLILMLAQLALADDVVPCEDLVLPEPETVEIDETCQTEPRVGSFNPVVEWQWSDAQLRTTPMVANMSDDNGDGLIDENDIPDIVFVSFPSNDATTGPGTLYILSGDGSGVIASAESPIDGIKFVGAAGVAIGDLENDGSPDICVSGGNVAILCLEADLSLKWSAGSKVRNGWGYPSIADMDGDGFAEVVFGARIYDHQGNLLGQGDSSGDGDPSHGPISIVVDVDDDGQLEVVGGGSAWEMDGTLVWSDGDSDGYPAAGDFDGDGLPEFVRAGSSKLIMTDTDGTKLWTASIPGGGRGGPPTVADFDGDEEPEIGIAAAYYYIVYEADGTVRWQMPVDDASSNFTGSSVFDFEGDGRAEVVYADEKTLYVFDGEHGCVLLEMSEHDSGTHFEYPIIADVDLDGSAEIILGSNRRHDSSDWKGITVIGDAEDTWLPARVIWNQHAYSITHVNDDGSIPATVEDNWATFNSFRAGGLATGPSDWLADFQVPEVAACHAPCDGDRTVDVYATLSNVGLADGEDVEVLFYRWEDGERVEVHRTSVTMVAAGDAVRVGPVTLDEDQWGPTDLWVEANPDGFVNECDETSQAQVLGPWPFPEVDADGDGFDMVECGGLDCDDADFEIHPGAGEVAYDGIDNDCDPETPDDDLDGDGYPLDEDCNDMDPSVNPGMEEIPDNGIDENCDDSFVCPAVAHGGCDCSQVGLGTGALGLLPLLALVGLRRRERSC